MATPVVAASGAVDFRRSSSDTAVSIVIPVHDGTDALTRCLSALEGQLRDGDEIAVIDDASTEDVTGATAPFGDVTVHRLARRSGAAAARNRGVAVTGRPILFFLDADVVVHPDTLARGRERMADPSVDAVVGSYDEAPAAPALVSQFKNLAHHYFHQRAAGDVSSFWSACGFVRRDVFLEAGGFDARRFTHPSIEDVELGWRMTDRGARIVLEPRMQVTHLKRWTLRSLVTTDVIHRAVPWVRWSLQRGRLPAELNVSAGQRVAAGLAVLWVACGVGTISRGGVGLPFALVTLLALAVNWRLFALLWRRGGPKLFLAGFFLQKLYYGCALAGLAAGLILHVTRDAGATPAHLRARASND